MVSLKLSDYPKYQRKIKQLINLDLLILDDFLLHTITDEREIKVLFEILEKRCELSRSTIVCSQTGVEQLIVTKKGDKRRKIQASSHFVTQELL